jgi:hydroxyacylglutathione hydrolase
MLLEIPTRERNIHYDQVWDIGPIELMAALNDVTVIDVRLREEFSGELSSIPGAIGVPLLELIDGLIDLPQNKPLVLVCRNGWRSAKAAAYLVQRDNREVYSLKGGLLFWDEVLRDKPGILSAKIGKEN